VARKRTASGRTASADCNEALTLYKRAGAYYEARTLYQQVGDRRGEANVLRGLGDLEHVLGRNDQARTAYDDAAQLFGSLGMITHRDEALSAAGLDSTG
jgi:tetratricopeptide (TPR) repeat protein